MVHTTEELAELDSISRQIDIQASAEKVWSLITRPGWYVNDGTVLDEQDTRVETADDGTEIAVVTHPTMGEFRFRTVELDEPRYAAFRWLGTPYRDVTEGTLVEFWIEDNPAGGVTLKVLESGFSTLSDDPAVWLKEREGNDNGWAMELEAAKTYVEALA
ncbi:ATPase [Nocardioides sp. KC13]|uniref:ATPase n=1 Tax=Nocardioides turkmenicus TaxID=2711220 RepID=A0A6M1RHV4_9ACTN|nr:ATPase [Nocardioides sp. KC13]NGN95777.1 ATPase [Nocardioides sp. KC13]